MHMTQFPSYTVTEAISVSEQIVPEDIADIAALGFKTIINNRPDGEEPGQPSDATLAALALAQGINYRHIPVVMSSIAENDITAFRDACDTLPKPVLAFCRSGTRSISMWALAYAQSMDAADIVRIAKAGGYDLLPLVPRIQARQNG